LTLPAAPQTFRRGRCPIEPNALAFGTGKKLRRISGQSDYCNAVGGIGP
jgi:hypothetical protein